MPPAENQDEQTDPETSFPQRAPLIDWRRVLLSALVLASLISGGTAIHDEFGPWGWVKLRTGETQRSLEVKGRLDFDSPVKGEAWQNAGLVLMLPEIRASFVAYQKDLNINGAGEFCCRIFYVSKGPLHYVNVRGFCPGFEGQDFNGIAVSPDTTLALPRITLVRLQPGSSPAMPSPFDPGEP